MVSVSDLAIVAALVFGWSMLSARLERFDVTAPITFVLAGLLLTHGHAVAVITITVLLSVIANGATADPLATRYARLLARSANALAGAEVPGMPERRLIRRAASAHAPVAGDGPNQPNSPPRG